MVARRGPHAGRRCRSISAAAHGCARSIGTLVYAAVFAVAFISAPLALALAGVTAVYYVFAPVPRAGVEAEVEELTSGPL